MMGGLLFSSSSGSPAILSLSTCFIECAFYRQTSARHITHHHTTFGIDVGQGLEMNEMWGWRLFLISHYTFHSAIHLQRRLEPCCHIQPLTYILTFLLSTVFMQQTHYDIREAHTTNIDHFLHSRLSYFKDTLPALVKHCYYNIKSVVNFYILASNHNKMFYIKTLLSVAEPHSTQPTKSLCLKKPRMLWRRSVGVWTAL